MKVAYLLDSLSRKSAGLFEICRRLAQTSCRKDEIAVLGIADEYTNADMKEWASLEPRVFHAVGPRSFGYAPGYAEALASAAPDLAHVHGLWTYHSLAAYRWHRRTGRPLMYTAHGMFDPWALRNASWKKRLVRVLWEGAAHRSAACFHVNSEAEHQTLRRYGMRNPICVIPNGVDLPRFAENQGLRVGSPLPRFGQGRKILLYLGRLHPKKNLANLIRAWAEMLNAQRQMPNVQRSTLNSWVLAIAGWDQGGHEREIKKLTADHGLLTTVTFLGPLFGQEKDAAYRACDAFILPSLSEGLPMTVLEAWAHAKPVLMTPECNLPEGFAAGAALPIGTNSSEIAAGLGELLEMTDSERGKMGTSGRTLAAEKFSWPQIGQQMRAVYEWVIGGGTAPETVRMAKGNHAGH
jgi:glycosyltransferase involved in cell wall biosynthesis